MTVVSRDNNTAYGARDFERPHADQGRWRQHSPVLGDDERSSVVVITVTVCGTVAQWSSGPGQSGREHDVLENGTSGVDLDGHDWQRVSDVTSNLVTIIKRAPQHRLRGSKMMWRSTL